VSVHRRRSQIATVMTVTITTDNLLLRPKLDYDGGYDVAIKGASVVVSTNLYFSLELFLFLFSQELST
jgi:hypothetical protein